MERTKPKGQTRNLDANQPILTLGWRVAWYAILLPALAFIAEGFRQIVH